MIKRITKTPNKSLYIHKCIVVLTLHLLIFSNIHLAAQTLPAFSTLRIDYGKVKTVKYEMTDAAQEACLSLRELSQYHGYIQITNEVELIDLDGDLLTQTEFVVEENVRDDWMEGYHKIFVGKDSVYLFGLDFNIKYVSAKDTTDTELFTEEEASFYEYYNFGEVGYLENMTNFLIDSGVDYTNVLNILTMYYEGTTVMYDHNTKTTIITEYDSLAVKVKETTYEFTDVGGGIYIPNTETIIDWITTTNGCCVRKTTTIEYIGYTRVHTPGGLLVAPNKNEERKQNMELVANKEVEISSVSGSNQIYVKIDEEASSVEYEVVIYDITGKRISSKIISGNQAVDLPASARQGVYLIHIYNKETKAFVVGKAVLVSPN